MNSKKKYYIGILYVFTIALSIFLFQISCGRRDHANPMDPKYDGQPITETREVIGVTGGEIEVTSPTSPINGLKVIIPEGALSEDTEIEIAISDKPLNPPNENLQLIGNRIQLGPDSGIRFTESVIVEYPIGEVDPDFLDGLFVGLYNVENDKWDFPCILGNDTTRNILVFLTDHFSIVTGITGNSEFGNLECNPQFNYDGNIYNWDIFPIPNYNILGIGRCLAITTFTKWYFENKRDICPLYKAFTEISAKQFAEVVFGAILPQNIYSSLESRVTGYNESVAKSTFNSLSNALKLNGTPQILLMLSDQPGQGHSVLVYKILDRGNGISDIICFDPNYDPRAGISPRYIVFSQNQFSSYGSGMTLWTKFYYSGSLRNLDLSYPFSYVHAITTPNVPVGLKKSYVNQPITFITNGSICTQGHTNIQYKFYWHLSYNNQIIKSQSTEWGPKSVSITFDEPGTYLVESSARCVDNPLYESLTSQNHTIEIIELPLPAISVSPTPLSFGNVTRGSSGDKILRISNTGSATLDVTGISSTNAQFSVVGNMSFSISAGSYRDITVRFTPSATGTQAGTLNIYNNSSVNPKGVNMVGVGTGQPVISVSPTPLSFGNVTLGSSKDLTLRISNTGNATLSVTSISSTNSQFSAVGSTSFNVSAGSYRNVTVRFTPTSAGNHGGTLRIYNNSSVNPKEVNMVGVGTGEPVISVSPISLSFGNVSLGSSGDTTLRISNTGGATLNVSSVSSTNSQFNVVGSTSFSISAGSYRDITVRFTPSSTGTQAGTLNIYNNSSVNPKSVNMVGVGTGEPVISVSPISLSFGNVSLGSSGDTTLRISNTGGATLNVSSVSSTNSQFNVVGSTSFSISAGSYRDITVRFTPSATGTQAGTLNIYNNSSVNPKDVNMVGVGTEASYITVTSPNGGESWQLRSSHDITWNRNTGGNVKIELYKGSSYYQTITSSTSNDGSYSWSIPANYDVYSNYRIKITSTSDESVYDDSNGYFSLIEAPRPVISVSPPSLSFGNVTLGSSGDEILRISNTGSATLDVTGISSTNAQFSVVGNMSFSISAGSYRDITVRFTPSATGTQAGTLNIYNNSSVNPKDVNMVGVGTEASYITVTSPNGGESWQLRSSHDITWNRNTGGNVKIELYKGSSYYQTITSSTSNDGSYSWSIPANYDVYSNYRIKITSTGNSSLYDYSNSYFILTEVPSFTVTPNPIFFGTVNVNQFLDVPLTFSNTGNTTLVISDIVSTSSEFSIIGNTSFSVPGNGNHIITVRFSPISAGTKTAMLKIYNNSPDNPMFIVLGGYAVDTPTITVIAPNGGENWQLSSTHTITWSSNAGGNVKIELYKGSSYYRTITSSTSNDDSYNWSIPASYDVYSSYRIKITSTSNSSMYDYSNSYFSLTASPYIITVTYPNGGESWQLGSNHNITWDSNAGGNVKIELYKGSSYYKTITSSTTNDGHYGWYMSNSYNSGNDYKVKITSKSNSSIYDFSDTNFSLYSSNENCLYVVTNPDQEILDILNQLNFNVYQSSTIPSNLSGYKLVICAEYSACTPTTAPYIKNFISNGGGAILLGGTPSTFCGGGYSISEISDWFGTSNYSNVGVSDARVAYNNPLGTNLQEGDILAHCTGWGGAAVKAVSSTATILANWDYDSGNIFSFIYYYQYGRVGFWAGFDSNYYNNKVLFKGLCRWAGGN